MHSQNRTHSFPVRRKQRGLSFVEMLAAAAIIGVALISLVSSWLYVVHAALLSDDRSAAYQVARTVIERARANGAAVNQPVMVSTPAFGNSRSNWISPSVLRNRFYDTTLEELGGGNNDQNPPAPPANAAFRAITMITVSPDNTRPADRDDLRLITISVVVHKVNRDGTLEPDSVSTLQTCLTQGGLL